MVEQGRRGEMGSYFSRKWGASWREVCEGRTGLGSSGELTEARTESPHFPGGTFFWLVVKLPVHDKSKETVTRQACGADGGSQRVRRGWQSRAEGRGRSGAVLKGGEQACLAGKFGGI